MPVMYRGPSGIQVGGLESDDPESDEYIERDVNVLAYASPGAFIDILGDGSEGNVENDAPGDIAPVSELTTRNYGNG